MWGIAAQPVTGCSTPMRSHVWNSSGRCGSSRLAQMSEGQRQGLIDAFWDEMCEGMDLDPEAERRMRAARPDLPDSPSPEQVEAWIEFAELIETPASGRGSAR